MKNELHQTTDNIGSWIGMKFSHIWIKAKVTFLFEYISTLLLLPPKPPDSNFDSFITKNSPAPLAGMCFVLFTIMYHNCVFINKCLQLLAHFFKIWLPQVLGIFTALLGNYDSNSHTRMNFLTYSSVLSGFVSPPWVPDLQPSLFLPAPMPPSF